MRIEEEIKLAFKDVLIRPKRSQLSSRSEVSLEREFKFLHSGKTWKGVPIIAANMDHTGTFNMAAALSNHKVMTALTKFIEPEQWVKFVSEKETRKNFTFVSAGLNDKDIPRLEQIQKQADFDFICLDVANGYTQRFVDFIKKVRDTLVAPKK